MFKKRNYYWISALLLTATACSTIHNRNQQTALYQTELGLAYLKQGQTVPAKQKLQLALSQAPNNPMIQDAMAYFLEQTGEIKLAESHYQRAIHLAPRAGAPRNNYGAYLCRQGRYQAAIQSFLQAAADEDYLETAKAYQNAGVCALRVQDTVNAKQYFEQAVQRDPQLAVALLELTKLSYNHGDYQAAQGYFQRYAELVPPSSTVQQMAAQLRQKRLRS